MFTTVSFDVPSLTLQKQLEKIIKLVQCVLSYLIATLKLTFEFEIAKLGKWFRSQLSPLGHYLILTFIPATGKHTPELTLAA